MNTWIIHVTIYVCMKIHAYMYIDIFHPPTALAIFIHEYTDHTCKHMYVCIYIHVHMCIHVLYNYNICNIEICIQATL